jgi:hypothetical protein
MKHENFTNLFLNKNERHQETPNPIFTGNHQFLQFLC